MDPGAPERPVTVVIKAPNQKYEDQSVRCSLHWTVERLKDHISVVYPSRPRSRDQRLVYSGRLLQDHLQLSEVLRQQDEYHMMHLVCSSHSPPTSPRPGSSSVANSPEPSGPDADGPHPHAGPSTQGGPPPSSSSGLRYRGSAPPFDPQAPPGVPQWPDGAQVPLQGGAAAPPYVPLQLMWWQQMYARHYYMQYQAAVAASQPRSSAPPARLPEPAPEAAPPEPDPLPQDRWGEPVPMNAQGGGAAAAPAPAEEPNRDWLDWLYTASRAAVLLSIVYFYSSFGRFVAVLGAVLLVYLHQAGWFPFRADLQNLRGDAGGGPEEEAGRRRDMQEMERLMDEGLEEDEGGEEDPPQPAAAAAAPPELSFLATVWSFISTFFTSLIPEGRPHQAN